MQNDRYTMIPFNYMPKCSQEHVLLMGIRTCMGKMILFSGWWLQWRERETEMEGELVLYSI